MLPVKDDIPTDRAPLITLALIAAAVATGVAFGGGLVPWAADVALLWYAGPAVEDAMGRVRYCAFAAGAAGIGFAVQLAVDGGDPTALAAAGGLACALAAAHVRLYPWARIQSVVLAPLSSTIVGVPLAVLFAVWVVVQALVGVLGWGDVPIAGQAAGLCFGLLLAGPPARHVKTRDELLRQGRARTT